MATDQYPFDYKTWAKLTLSGGADKHSFPAMGAEGSDFVTPVPKTGGGGGGDPERWMARSNFAFNLDSRIGTLEGGLPAPNTPVEITILDHFPPKAAIIAQLAIYAAKPSAHPIFQLLIDGLNGPTANNFEITVDEPKHPLLTTLLTTPPPPGESFEKTLQDYNNNPEVRAEIGHGIFIAGIITQLLADQGSLDNVKLHLVSVLNEKQLGLISDIADAIQELKTLHQNDPTKQRLVNCSIQVFTPFDPPLGMNTGEVVDFIQRLAGFAHDAEVKLGCTGWASIFLKFALRRLSVIEVAAELLMDVTSIFEVGELLRLTTFLERMDNFEIIAAAGNLPTSITVDQPPLPTYPAHIHTVLGVGSIGRRQGTQPPKLAPFSRRSQVRENSTDGITTLGDVVGPYIGNIATVPNRKPDGTPMRDSSGNLVFPTTSEITTNFTGFVRWSGTSFSTAIITGLMARLCRRGRTAEQAFDDLRGLALQNDSANGSDVQPLFVTQP